MTNLGVQPGGELVRGDVGEDGLPAGGQVAPVTVQEEVQHETGHQARGQVRNWDGDEIEDQKEIGFIVLR